MTSTRPSMKEIEDAADEALSEAQDRTEALDQRGADMAGKIADLEAECADLQLRVAAKFCEIGLEPILPLTEVEKQCAIVQHVNGKLLDRIEQLETELRLAKDETASIARISSRWQIRAGDLNRERGEINDKLRVEVGRNLALNKQLDAATELVSKVEDERDASRVHYETASVEVSKLRNRIAEATNRTSDVVIYSANTVDGLRGQKQRTEAEVERETHGNTEGV